MNLNAPMSAHAISFPSYKFLTLFFLALSLSHVLMISTFLFSLLLSLYTPLFHLASSSSVLLDHLYVYVLL